MSTMTYKCPNCDGGLIFDPNSHKYKCEYCRSSFQESELPSDEQNQQDSAAGKTFYGETGSDTGGGVENANIYSCPSCGAEVIAEETTAATWCYYCHNPVVLKGRLDGSMKPDKLIPFSIDKDAAVKGFLQWAKKKKFIPRAFFSKKQIELISGVYFPYWMYECDVFGTFDAKATKVRTWRTGNIQHTETEHYSLVREGELHFSDIVKNALKKADDKLTEGVQPFDFSQLRDFTMLYLSGFRAEKRDVETAELEPEIENEIKNYTETLLRDTANGFSTVSPVSVGVNRHNSVWKYALLPVWILTYRDKNKKAYFYAMNGQTGKVCGVLPVDFRRLLLLFLGVALPLFALLLLGGYML